MNPIPSRRDVLKTVAVGAAGVALSPFLTMCADLPGASASAKKKILFFTRSQDFPHEMVTRKSPDVLAFGEQTFKDVGERAGYDVTVSKDGTLFAPDKIGQFDAFVFYTTGDLTQPPGTKYKSDQTPAMPPEGKVALLNAIATGKGIMGLHCGGSDTFHSPGYENKPKTAFLRAAKPGPEVDPFIAMMGGEFNSHGSQQNATIRVVDPRFPGLEGLPDFTMNEEWYSLYNLAPDLHVILVQDTTTMKTNANGQHEWQYQRDPYPETWARAHGQGRVFYSSMGHRQDVWTSPIYQQVFTAGLAWTSGRVHASIPPNLATACPGLYKSEVKT